MCSKNIDHRYLERNRDNEILQGKSFIAMCGGYLQACSISSPIQSLPCFLIIIYVNLSILLITFIEYSMNDSVLKLFSTLDYSFPSYIWMLMLTLAKEAPWGRGITVACALGCPHPLVRPMQPSCRETGARRVTPLLRLLTKDGEPIWCVSP